MDEEPFGCAKVSHLQDVSKDNITNSSTFVLHNIFCMECNHIYVNLG